jgi:hypothetical protein
MRLRRVRVAIVVHYLGMVASPARLEMTRLAELGKQRYRLLAENAKSTKKRQVLTPVALSLSKDHEDSEGKTCERMRTAEDSIDQKKRKTF